MELDLRKPKLIFPQKAKTSLLVKIKGKIKTAKANMMTAINLPVSWFELKILKSANPEPSQGKKTDKLITPFSIISCEFVIEFVGNAIFSKT